MAKKTDKGEVILRAEGIVKDFPGIWEHLILDHVDFDVQSGEIHALLGDNGAGKTVLANILSGFYFASEGQIYVRGKPVLIKSPKDALSLGIGMVHQEFTLVRPLTVAENVALGLDSGSLSFPTAYVERKIEELSDRYHLKVDPRAVVGNLSVGEQQRVEILKVLFYRPDVLIMDEPTSVLTPRESKELFSVLRSLANEGNAVVFITHRLQEVMEISDRVTVLKLGKMVGTKRTSETNERELVSMMIGPIEPSLPKVEAAKEGNIALEVSDLHIAGDQGLMMVKGVSFAVREGEILGIAGVAGNGQRELIEALTGLRSVAKGKVTVFGKDLTSASPRDLAKQGVCHIPEERRRTGMAEGLNLTENLMMKDYLSSPFSRFGFLDHAYIARHAAKLVSEFEITAPDLDTTVTRILSGGNIQRAILARELWKEPRLIIASHPTYGLDLRAVEHTYRLFARLKEKGSAILLVSEDLEEIMTLSDRIAVMFNGKILGIREARQAKAEEIGLMMTGIVP